MTFRLEKFQTPALGKSMPDSRHACVSCLPTFEDVCGYETADPRVVKAMETGYPRFVVHSFIEKCQTLARAELLKPGEDLVLLNSTRSLIDSSYFLEGTDWFRTLTWEGVTALVYLETDPRVPLLKPFLQHTGARISSRQAEFILFSRGIIKNCQAEVLLSDSLKAREEIDLILDKLYPEIPKAYRFLSNSGMNSFFSVFRFLQNRAKTKKKKRWLQLGWLYMDTMEILQKFIPEGGELVTIARPGNTEEILRTLAQSPDEWAGIITEFPTNPTLECFDLPRISQWCKTHRVPLVVDPTLVTAWSVQLFPYADIVVTSYTKYAANEGDVMAGGVVINPDFYESDSLQAYLVKVLEPLSERDLWRLAVEIPNMEETVYESGVRNRILTEKLAEHPEVLKLYSIELGETAALFNKVRRPAGGPGAMLTVIFKNPQKVFNSIRMGKAPNFGLRFSLCCPFLYLAHYDLVSTEHGRAFLSQRGLYPELIRFSFGLEDPDDLWERLEEAMRP